MSSLRTVIYDERFEAELAAIEPDPVVAESFVEGAKWVLCRYPRYGTPIAPNSKVWFLPILDAWLVNFPSYGIYYTFNDDEVYLLSIRNSDVDATESFW